MVAIPRPDRAKHILVICTDQQRWDSLGCYGVDEVETPNVDRLAAGGTLFERCYATNPVCAPSRATMLTGTYPHQHGLWANGVKLPPGEVSLLRDLGAAGYRTGLVGKLHLGPCYAGRSEDPAEYGFDWVRWGHGPPQAAPDNAYHLWLKKEFPDLAAAAEGESTGGGRGYGESQPGSGSYHDMPSEASYTRWVAEQALEFIEDQQVEQPWMLWANFFDPHHPFVAPDEYVRRVEGRPRRPPIGSAADLEGRPPQLGELSLRSYAGHARGFAEYSPEELADARVRYWAMIDQVDEQVGRIVRAGEAAGDPQDLVVLFTSDHGEMLGDHGLMLKGPMLYEGAVRVPCVLRWPGRVPSSERMEGLVSLLDVAATLSDAAGIEPPPGNEGTSLVRVARGDAEPKRVVVTECHNSGHPYEPPVVTSMVRDDHYKAIVWHRQEDPDASPTGELYDLDADPEEMHDLWSHQEMAEVKAALLAQLCGVLALGGNGWKPREARF